MIAFVALFDLELEQLGVKTFLHVDLEEKIFMIQHLICHLKKSLYGLKQAPREWYKIMDSFMIAQQYS